PRWGPGEPRPRPRTSPRAASRVGSWRADRRGARVRRRVRPAPRAQRAAGSTDAFGAPRSRAGFVSGRPVLEPDAAKLEPDAAKQMGRGLPTKERTFLARLPAGRSKSCEIEDLHHPLRWHGACDEEPPGSRWKGMPCACALSLRLPP